MKPVIVVTRAKDQAEEFAAALMQRGMEVILFPVIECVPPVSWEACDAQLDRLERFTGVILTSSNAAEFFLSRAAERGCIPALRQRAIYPVGERTASAVRTFGLTVEPVPPEFSAAALAAHIVARSSAGSRFLFAKGDLAGDAVEKHLTAAGLTTESVTVYRTQEPAFDEQRRELADTIAVRADMAAFFSPSGVHNFLRRIPAPAAQRLGIAVIGETTAAAVRAAGLNVTLIAPRSTATDLAEAIREYFSLKTEREYAVTE